MGAIRELTKAINVLADSVFGLTTELAIIRKDKAKEKMPFKTSETTAKVFTGCTIEPTPGRSRWTKEEEQIILAGYENGLKPKAIRDRLAALGFKRGEHAIVDHMHELRKRAKK